MVDEWLSRTELLVGKENIKRLKKAHVLVVGLGGVGGYAAENICRAGVGKMTIVDGDVIGVTNRNRQLPAVKSNEGKLKAEIIGKRLLDINPALKLEVIPEYIKEERIEEILKMHPYDYVVDAIDTLSPKINLIYRCMSNNLKLVSSMGSGGKLDPTQIRITDFSKTYNCRLAYILRKKLRKMGVTTGFKVVFSAEKTSGEIVPVEEQNKKSVIGTISYMPPVFGCFITSVVVNDLIEMQDTGSMNQD